MNNLALIVSAVLFLVPVSMRADTRNDAAYGQLVQVRSLDPIGSKGGQRALPPVGDVDGDGVSDATESGAPNGGDGNNDGVPDSQQNCITSLPNAVDGSYMTLCTCDGMMTPMSPVNGPSRSPTTANHVCENANVEAVVLDPEGYTLPFGAIRFKLRNCLGRRVTMFYHNVSSLLSPPFEYVKWGPNPPGSPVDVVYTLSTGTPNFATFGSASPYGVPVGIAMFDLVEGQQGDDFAGDGDIDDQGGAGFEQPTAAPALSVRGLVAAFALLLSIGVLSLGRLRRG